MSTTACDRMALVRADITAQKVDAIVNAANSSLLGGGGVDGAIHRAAGPRLLAECEKIGGCPTGQARITKGYDLPAKHVIHTVGPVYRGGDKGEPELLTACYRNSLQLAVDNGIQTIAFPAISCGVYGYPIEKAARIALETTAGFLTDHPEILQVRFVLFGQADHEVYADTLATLRHEQ
ncbi:MAG: O-acetyl-ADP-ribose deacetylase [Phycisphaerae bacterium]|nr:O-acetyl-ADP-ribose deacetylase [Phycisphaerae bacterium]